MIKIIRCIIILFIVLSPAILCAQKQATSFLKTTENHYNKSNYTEARATSENAIRTILDQDKDIDSMAVARLYFYKGASEYYLQRFDASIRSYNKGMLFCTNNDIGINYKAELLYERAFSQYELDDHLNSYESSKEAVILMNSVEKPNYDYLLSIYCDLASSAANLGFEEEATNYINKAKTLYTIYGSELPRVKNEASKPVLFAYKAVEIIHSKTELDSTDILQIQQQIQTLETLQRTQKFNLVEKRMHAVSLNFLADVYIRSTSDSKKALSYLNKALRILPKKFSEAHTPQFQFNKVKAYSQQQKYDKALVLINSLVNKLPKTDQRLSYFEAEKANILLAQNNKEQALAALQRSVNYIHNDTTILKEDYSNFQPSFDLHETGLFVEMADKIVQQYPKDSLVLPFAANMYKLGLVQFENCYHEELFNKKLTNYYQKAIGGILKLKKLGYGYKDLKLKELLNTMEVIENRLAWKQFQKNRFLQKSAIPDAVLNEEYLIRKALVSAKKRKDTMAVFQYTTQLKQYHHRLQQEYPNIATFAFNTFTIETIQKTLNDTKAILKYKRIGDDFYVFKITKNDINFYEIDNTDHELEAAVETFYKQLSNQQEDKVLARVLHSKLLPFKDENLTEYTIIPDHILHYIPFETLVTPEVNYLIEKVYINYASHLVFVNHNKTKNVVPNDDIIVFTPTYTDAVKKSEEIALRDEPYRLIGAERESQLLATIFPSTLFESILATKDNFIKYSQKAKIIHLAMHANIDNETPELSHLLFNQNGKDTKMYVEELYGLHLNADLAVLSACNTGKGTLDASQGVVSLNRAFTMAGVPSTLSSLWEVPDKVTQKIMVDFYKNLRNGESKTTALRNAKLNYLKSTSDANFQVPFYWAGFVLHGDTSPIHLQKSCTPFIIVIFLIIAAIIAFIVVRRIKTNTLKLF